MNWREYVSKGWGAIRRGFSDIKARTTDLTHQIMKNYGDKPAETLGKLASVGNVLDERIGRISMNVGNAGQKLAENLLGRDNFITKAMKSFNKGLTGAIIKDDDPQRYVDNNAYRAYTGGSNWRTNKPLMGRVRILSDMPWIDHLNPKEGIIRT
ncbi:hypothetical protein TVAG_105520 [Trichomonas vaginalis G3]|uniref:Uncharacterized protein n=1 Tax=Trichomonas vaginalis (strain ATCC PRA-98 / G3) TaxID=412133 RepID=A2G3W2_TRIV3|nr:hypothetical protein TVAGG3_0117070 [Trichomonas vaginalis G3]EAX88151.1 hypothetical protein TVAG_105520 [Trichomonas vaginalis G3]KAI5545244.1 hypothetical protein TVAGG3_0117070 [Trichomonas vaginalis G3]|eukprot:XP_001301081.1 hypothetical protein [Trichomonas vaginalis G3]